ncbi:hypothetical protein N7468_010503 [Penicillium chermesinum]|uniref:Uncharacterized protein n=1 Tax=Penicillium chermesinum TaxID=63820 RepID=A0A9W9N945_9EURO|nr:uncharacterized protein N7468_010503 [Penicillium chermesinum]KAJ5214824.1 hypothetical protein N7468_010503 [Penicillium chermesinum]KAJ6141671.1 hypothetical protein N7470_010061 [Penicillium chermesinum]
MSSKTAPVTVVPPTSHEALSFTQDIRAIMVGSNAKPDKRPHLVDNLPPAPPPSPVSFATNSTGKAPGGKREKIPSLSLE